MSHTRDKTPSSNLSKFRYKKNSSNLVNFPRSFSNEKSRLERILDILQFVRQTTGE